MAGTRSGDHTPPPLLRSDDKGALCSPGEAQRIGPVVPLVRVAPSDVSPGQCFTQWISAKQLHASPPILHREPKFTTLVRHRFCGDVQNDRWNRVGRSVTYDPLCKAPEGMAVYNAAHAQAVVNTGFALERAERLRSRVHASDKCMHAQRSRSVSGGAMTVGRSTHDNSREEMRLTKPPSMAERSQSPVLHYKELTQAFYDNHQGGALAQEAYLHYMAAASGKRAGTKGAGVRLHQQKQQQKEEFRRPNSTHLDDGAKVNSLSRWE